MGLAHRPGFFKKETKMEKVLINGNEILEFSNQIARLLKASKYSYKEEAVAGIMALAISSMRECGLSDQMIRDNFESILTHTKDWELELQN